MNNTFDIKRFGFVFRKDLMENWKRYTLLLLTMLGIMAIVFIWPSLEYYSFFERNGRSYTDLNHNLLAFASLMFGGFGILFASTFMNPMNSKTKRGAWLVSPSSMLEKYLSRWLIVTVGYMIAFFAALWIVDMLRVGLCTARYPDLEVKFLDYTKLIVTGDGWKKREYVFEKDLFIIVTSLYFLFQSLFILGSTFWEKSSFIKTFTAGAIILLAFVLFCRWTILLSYGDFEHFGNMLNSFESIEKDTVSKEQATLFAACVLSVCTLANWILAFFRLRESEIIKRI
ncbi:MAG: hypothetical protein LBL57_01150 [Tannerella sp.]|jgi:hypothetical protein|nr:hypothetical protein [Tannerella sp.]